MQTLLDIAAIFITPDWTALIALIPIGLALLFVAWFLFTLRKWATVGPSRRAPARVPAVTPEGVHMPGGSAAPVLVALGAAALFGGLILGGVWILAGTTALILTLLVWFNMAVRDYDLLEPVERLPAIRHPGPPPGVHMPGPSIRPLMGALGAAVLLGGLVMGGWVLALGVVFLAWTLIGWLVDFTAEYRKVEEADHTGHLENIPPRRIPTRALQVFTVLFLLVGMWQLGIFPPPGEATAGGEPGSSAAPSGPVAPPGSLTLIAKNLAFDQTELEVEAGKPFTISFENQDPAATIHDVDIRAADGTTVLQDQPTITGGQSQVYEYTALEAGTYTFICSIHPIPSMTGTLTVR